MSILLSRGRGIFSLRNLKSYIVRLSRLLRFNENRPRIPAAMHDPESDNDGSSLPVPPERLRERVHGAKDLAGFNRVGRAVSRDITSAIQLASAEIGAGSRVLDFGCGCGRVLRWLPEIYERCELYGVDIDQEAISWCQENLSDVGVFSCNAEMPPLDFNDDYFSLLYAISIFTHLPEEMQLNWLKELKRIVKIGGYLILTVHGKELFPTKSKYKLKLNSLLENGFYYMAGLKTEGLPDFYGHTFHTEDYIYDRWGKFFEIKKIIKKGIANNQDLILCRSVK